jgi:hypothetical protein
MDSRTQSAFTSLPAEILIKVLLLLPTPGALLSATRTCKALHELFLSQAVQYSFQLQTSHQQDWTVLDAKIAPAPAAERLAVLSERQQRWRTLEWKRCVTRPGQAAGRLALRLTLDRRPSADKQSSPSTETAAQSTFVLHRSCAVSQSGLT